MRRYLIVDDNLEFAENVAEILSDRGATAVVADGGEAALVAVAKTRFDALVCDMRMPVMNGAEVVHRLRAVDPALPAIVATAFTGDEDLAAARQEGLLAVLPKPLPLLQLLELVASAKRGGLVALVEDDRAMADNVSELLRQRGFGTVTATSVLETERLRGVRPFAALVDLRLPGGLDGEGMARLDARFPGLPMIVLSAHHDVTPPLQPVARMAKPFDSAALLEAVEALYVAHVQG